MHDDVGEAVRQQLLQSRGERLLVVRQAMNAALPVPTIQQQVGFNVASCALPLTNAEAVCLRITRQRLDEVKISKRSVSQRKLDELNWSSGFGLQPGDKCCLFLFNRLPNARDVEFYADDKGAKQNGQHAGPCRLCSQKRSETKTGKRGKRHDHANLVIFLIADVAKQGGKPISQKAFGQDDFGIFDAVEREKAAESQQGKEGQNHDPWQQFSPARH